MNTSSAGADIKTSGCIATSVTITGDTVSQSKDMKNVASEHQWNVLNQKQADSSNTGSTAVLPSSSSSQGSIVAAKSLVSSLPQSFSSPPPSLGYGPQSGDSFPSGIVPPSLHDLPQSFLGPPPSVGYAPQSGGALPSGLVLPSLQDLPQSILGPPPTLGYVPQSGGALPSGIGPSSLQSLPFPFSVPPPSLGNAPTLGGALSYGQPPPSLLDHPPSFSIPPPSLGNAPSFGSVLSFGMLPPSMQGVPQSFSIPPPSLESAPASLENAPSLGGTLSFGMPPPSLQSVPQSFPIPPPSLGNASSFQGALSFGMPPPSLQSPPPLFSVPPPSFVNAPPFGGAQSMDTAPEKHGGLEVNDALNELSKRLPPNIMAQISAGNLSAEQIEKIAEMVPIDFLLSAVQQLRKEGSNAVKLVEHISKKCRDSNENDALTELSTKLPSDVMAQIRSGNMSAEQLQRIAQMVPVDVLLKAVKHLQNSAIAETQQQDVAKTNIESTVTKSVSDFMNNSGKSIAVSLTTSASKGSSRLNIIKPNPSTLLKNDINHHNKDIDIRNKDMDCRNKDVDHRNKDVDICKKDVDIRNVAGMKTQTSGASKNLGCLTVIGPNPSPSEYKDIDLRNMSEMETQISSSNEGASNAAKSKGISSKKSEESAVDDAVNELSSKLPPDVMAQILKGNMSAEQLHTIAEMVPMNLLLKAVVRLQKSTNTNLNPTVAKSVSNFMNSYGKSISMSVTSSSSTNTCSVSVSNNPLIITSASSKHQEIRDTKSSTMNREDTAMKTLASNGRDVNATMINPEAVVSGSKDIDLHKISRKESQQSASKEGSKASPQSTDIASKKGKKSDVNEALNEFRSRLPPDKMGYVFSRNTSAEQLQKTAKGVPMDHLQGASGQQQISSTAVTSKDIATMNVNTSITKSASDFTKKSGKPIFVSNTSSASKDTSAEADIKKLEVPKVTPFVSKLIAAEVIEPETKKLEDLVAHTQSWIKQKKILEDKTSSNEKSIEPKYKSSGNQDNKESVIQGNQIAPSKDSLTTSISKDPLSELSNSLPPGIMEKITKGKMSAEELQKIAHMVPLNLLMEAVSSLSKKDPSDYDMRRDDQNTSRELLSNKEKGSTGGQELIKSNTRSDNMSLKSVTSSRTSNTMTGMKRKLDEVDTNKIKDVTAQSNEEKLSEQQDKFKQVLKQLFDKDKNVNEEKDREIFKNLAPGDQRIVVEIKAIVGFKTTTNKQILAMIQAIRSMGPNVNYTLKTFDPMSIAQGMSTEHTAEEMGNMLKQLMPLLLSCATKGSIESSDRGRSGSSGGDEPSRKRNREANDREVGRESRGEQGESRGNGRASRGGGASRGNESNEKQGTHVSYQRQGNTARGARESFRKGDPNERIVESRLHVRRSDVVGRTGTTSLTPGPMEREIQPSRMGTGIQPLVPGLVSGGSIPPQPGLSQGNSGQPPYVNNASRALLGLLHVLQSTVQGTRRQPPPFFPARRPY